MPVACMDTHSEARLTTFSGDESQSSPDWVGDDSTSERQFKRREKNRDAARKSRKKQTEKADLLHEELQALEHSNAAFEKEIAELRSEIQRYTTALKHHEPHCLMLHQHAPAVPPRTAVTTSTLSSTSNATPACSPNPFLHLPSVSVPSHDPLMGFSLSEFLDGSDLFPWD